MNAATLTREAPSSTSRRRLRLPAPLLAPGHSALDRYADALIDDVMRHLPARLTPVAGSRHPLLQALSSHDRSTGTDLAKRLLFASAVAHRDADERWVAEYLLRLHCRAKAGSGVRQFLQAGRCAAAMASRREQTKAMPTAPEMMACFPSVPEKAHRDDPSVCDMVLAKLPALVGAAPTPRLAYTIGTAVAIAVSLAERHQLNGGRVPSLIAMRSDARRSARLLTHLRDEFDNDLLASTSARLLAGPDKSPVEAGLLWWCARTDVDIDDVPPKIRSRWERDLRAAERAITASPR